MIVGRRNKKRAASHGSRDCAVRLAKTNEGDKKKDVMDGYSPLPPVPEKFESDDVPVPLVCGMAAGEPSYRPIWGRSILKEIGPVEDMQWKA